MKVIFRVDASNRMGTGHVTRCLALAEVLHKRGVETRFVCRAHVGNLIELLQSHAMVVTVLPEPDQPVKETHDDEYATFLGATKVEDAKQTIEALNGDHPDWLVVDHYGLDADWEQLLRPHASKLMVIDDLANRPHNCDLLLDQNYNKAGRDRYQDLVPENCHILLGPRFALLKPAYAACRQTLRPRDGKLRRVLVFFGGSDYSNATALAIKALSEPEFARLEVDVVIGAGNQHRDELEQLASKRQKTNLFGPQPDLAYLMAQADLAIGAGGATTWERMCMGLPSLVMCIAENQKPVCKELSSARLIHYVGRREKLRSEQLCGALGSVFGNRKWLLECATQGRLLVDGYGACRLAEILIPTQEKHLRLRPARNSDIGFYFNWVNDDKVRQQSIQRGPILWKDHKEWFASKLLNPGSYLFVLMAGLLPVGQIRFDREGDEARIDYSLDSLVRGRGWGARLVRMGVSLLQESESIRLRAEVKIGNQSSRKIFIRLGFNQIMHDKVRGIYIFCK